MELEQINKIANKKIISKRIIGIEILRMFLCFRIILLHYYSGNNRYILKMKSNTFQVSTFFFISFYFLYPIISQINFVKLKLRLERLLIPYIIYPIIVWIINNLMFLITKFNRFNRLLTINELKLNLIIGRGIFGIGVLWFHFNLLIFTLLFFISSFYMKGYFLMIFQILSSISYIIQYSRNNYNFFQQFNYNISLSVGSLIETFPIAIFAFSLASINIFKIFLKNRLKYIYFSCFFLYLILNYNIYSYLEGYSSTGIYNNIIAFFLFNIFFLAPFEILNSKILHIILQLTKYTQGIYCLHFLIQQYIRKKFDENGSFIGCFILYIISYIFSFIGFKIFEKTKLKSLFS